MMAWLLLGGARGGAGVQLELQELVLSRGCVCARRGLIYAQENNGNKYFVYDAHERLERTRRRAQQREQRRRGVLGGKIYVSYTNNSAEIGVYDIATNSWTAIANAQRRHR